MVWAVIIGDVIGSSDILEYREHILDYLQDSFRFIDEYIDKTETVEHIKFDIYRGDSFQGIIHNPVHALKSALFIRAHLISKSVEHHTPLDCRIAIGVGEIEYPHKKVGLGEGEAYRLASSGMDSLKNGKKTFSIKISEGESGRNRQFGKELEVESTLFDGIIQDWTAHQADAVKYQILGYNQSAIAKEIGVSQGSVSRRLDGARYWAIGAFLKRYEEIIVEMYKKDELVKNL